MFDKPVKILVIGSINMDLVMSLERVPQEGETVLGQGYSYIPGGKGANQAIAAARLGGEVTFCGRVGNDSNGDILLKNLTDNRINTKYITKDADSPSGLAVIPVEKSGQNRIMVFAGANGCVTPKDVDRALEEHYDVIMMQLEIPLEIVYYAFQKASASGIPVILDAGPAVKMDMTKFRNIFMVSPNETEAAALTGIEVRDIESAIKAARVLKNETNAAYVIIKMGEKGSLLYTNGNYELFHAYDNIEVIDSTAAGDSFIAAVAVKMLQYRDIRDAMRYGNAAGAICVGRKGAQPSLPTARELSEYLAARK
jgi:ribokinase